MTIAQITKAQERSNTKFNVAKAVRQLLDEARKAYGPQAWDDEDLEAQIIELVTDEG